MFNKKKNKRTMNVYKVIVHSKCEVCGVFKAVQPYKIAIDRQHDNPLRAFANMKDGDGKYLYTGGLCTRCLENKSNPCGVAQYSKLELVLVKTMDMETDCGCEIL